MNGISRKIQDLISLRCKRFQSTPSRYVDFFIAFGFIVFGAKPFLSLYKTILPYQCLLQVRSKFNIKHMDTVLVASFHRVGFFRTVASVPELVFLLQKTNTP